jgi:D-sedoheptulose 7-phosphate isomerase
MKGQFRVEIDAYFEKLKRTLDLVSRDELDNFLALLLDALDRGCHVFIMGNGGSSSTASHFVADFNKGLSLGKKKRFRFSCLSDNTATITAYANDLSYDDIFVEQLRNFLEPQDLVIAISGSGNSRNIINAVEYANAVGAATLGLTGYDGGALKKLAGHSVHIPIDDMQVTEDLHMVLDHMAYAILGRHLPVEDSPDAASAGNRGGHHGRA